MLDMVPGWLKVGLLVLFGVMCFEFGHSTAKTAAELKASKLVISQQTAATAQAEKDKEDSDKRTLGYEADVEKLNKDLKAKEDELKKLAADVDAGPVKLYVKAKCPITSSVRTTDSTGRIEDARAELDASGRQDYFALLGQVAKTEDQLTKCLTFAKKNSRQ